MIKRSFISNIVNELFYGGHLQSLGASSIIIFTSFVFDLPIDYKLVWIAYLLFYPIYLYNRYIEIDIDKETNKERSMYLYRYVNTMPWLIILVVALLLLCLFWFYRDNIVVILLTFFMLSFGFLYTSHFKSLTKYIFVFKNYYVAIFFALLVLIFQFSYELSYNTLFILTFLFIFTKALLMQIVLDIKDINSDATSGIKTFPVLFGQYKSIKVVLILEVIISIIFAYLFFIFGNILISYIVILFVPFVILSLMYIRNKNYFGYIMYGGEFLYLGLLVIIFKIWILY